MEYALLRSLRTLSPGLVILAFTDAFLVFALAMPSYFWNLDTSKIILVGYVVGAIYCVFADLLKRDRAAFSGVEEAIVDALDRAFPGAKSRGWERISPCFYAQIDADKSLEIKAQGVRFNGLVVTASFDAFVLSIIAVLTGLGAALLGFSCVFIAIALLVSVVSFSMWRLAIRKHCVLAKGQVNAIRVRFSQSFSQCAGVDPQGPTEGGA